MIDPLRGLLSGATLELRSRVAPAISLSLDSQEESALLRLARPSIVIRRGGQVVLASAPYGEPEPWAPLATIAACVVGLVLLFLALVWVRP